MWIQHPTKGRMKFDPYPFQEELLETYNGYRFAIAMCARQTGKTTCAAGYLLWYAMFHPDTLNINCGTQISRCTRYYATCEICV